jgi:hypothetical protein
VKKAALAQAMSVLRRARQQAHMRQERRSRKELLEGGEAVLRKRDALAHASASKVGDDLTSSTFRVLFLPSYVIPSSSQLSILRNIQKGLAR